MNSIFCYCTNCPEKGDAENETCYLNRGGQCFSAVEEVWNTENKVFEAVRTFGCMSDSEEHDSLLQCQGNLVESYYGRSILCCNYTDLCNKNLFPQYKVRDTSVLSPDFFYEDNIYMSILLGTIILGVLILLSYVVYISYKAKKDDRSRKYLIKNYNIKTQKSNNGFPGGISSSGSGVGNPLLGHTSFSRQVNRHQQHLKGRGRFSEVYVVEWNAVKIIEKVFNTQNEARWFREKEIYETTSIRDEKNILGYIASDILPSGLRAIYTDYYLLGSLHDYLEKTWFNYPDFFKLVKSASSAIDQLHTEILGTSRRPAVAHCNINSKNFFINNCKECAISNFEISVSHIGNNDTIEMETDLSTATPRYMAPEVVNETIVATSFDSLKMSDIYSLGLVLYEICQRCATIEGAVENHSLPFSNVLPFYPTIKDMQMLYVTEKYREDLLFIPSRWENDLKVLKPFLNIIRECLYENPKSRPTALRLNKNIKNLENANSGKKVDIL